MRKCVSISILAALLCLTATSSAAATATEFGDRCVGNDTESGWTVISQGNGETYPGISFEAGPKELRGGGPEAVITRWKVQVGPGIAPLRQQLVSLELAGEQKDLLLGESAIETLHEGTNEFATRLPSIEYGLIGLRGPDATLFCDKEEGHFLGLVEGDFPVGATRQVETQMDNGVPVIATVEPDVDRDGYGDETQDKCPWRPLFHDPCPTFELWLRTQAILRGAVLASVNVNAAATVRASAEVMIPRSKETLPPRVVPVDLGTQLVFANTPATFRVPLPKAAIKRLAKMRQKEKLKVRFVAAASDAPELEGKTRIHELTMRIPGRLRVHRPR